MRNNQHVKTMFTVGDFYLDVKVVEVQRKTTTTKNGNIFRRVKIWDNGHEAVLVIWGDKSNMRATVENKNGSNLLVT